MLQMFDGAREGAVPAAGSRPAVCPPRARPLALITAGRLTEYTSWLKVIIELV